jgi:hypothetical protein
LLVNGGVYLLVGRGLVITCGGGGVLVGGAAGGALAH